MLYDTDNYLVRENLKTEQYEVVNKINGFVEVETRVMVEALRMARILDFSLKAWREQESAVEKEADDFQKIDFTKLTMN
jgi:hypothetical protein